MNAQMSTTAEDVRKLRDQIQLIDGLSQEGFSEIAAIARLALLSLESPDGYNHLENVAHALTAICSKAGEIQSCINSEAGQVGCDHIDEAAARRYAAHSEAIQRRLSMRAQTHVQPDAPNLQAINP